MSRIEFEENSLNYLREKSKQMAETLRQSSAETNEVWNETTNEFGKVVSEIAKEINYVGACLDKAHSAVNSVNRKIGSAKSKMRSVPDLPSPPSDSKDSKAQQRYEAEKAKAEKERIEIEKTNADCKSEIVKAESCLKELQDNISVLKSCLQELKAIRTMLASAQSSFNTRRAHTDSEIRKSVTDMGTFCNIITETCAQASDILQVRSDFGFGNSVLRREFTIKVTTADGLMRNGRARVNFFGDAQHSDSIDVNIVADSSRRVVILRAIRSEDIFRELENERGLYIVKIPAANLHSLGGKDFISEMATRSFRLIKKGGTMIGNDGYITWENANED